MPQYLSEMEGAARRAAAEEALQFGGPLRPAWFDGRYTRAGRLAVSPLPGSAMFQRSPAADLATIRQQGVDHIVCLMEDHEFAKWGVADLLGSYQQAGFGVQRFPIRDQGVCSVADMRAIVRWLARSMGNGDSVLVHCVGGLGRSGIVAACYLVAEGLSPAQAIAEVRRTRSPYAIETVEQEEFVRNFTHDPGPAAGEPGSAGQNG